MMLLFSENAAYFNRQSSVLGPMGTLFRDLNKLFFAKILFAVQFQILSKKVSVQEIPTLTKVVDQLGDYILKFFNDFCSLTSCLQEKILCNYFYLHSKLNREDDTQYKAIIFSIVQRIALLKPEASVEDLYHDQMIFKILREILIIDSELYRPIITDYLNMDKLLIHGD